MGAAAPVLRDAVGLRSVDEYQWTGTPAHHPHHRPHDRRFGGEELKATVLREIIEGKRSAPSATASRARVRRVRGETRATRDGDGWRINGQKMSPACRVLEVRDLLARSSADAPSTRAPCLCALTRGRHIQPVHTFQEERTNVTYYDNVYVPDSYRLARWMRVKVMAGALETTGMTFARHHGECCGRGALCGDATAPAADRGSRGATATGAAAATSRRPGAALPHPVDGREASPISPTAVVKCSRRKSTSTTPGLLNLTAPESLAFESAEANDQPAYRTRRSPPSTAGQRGAAQPHRGKQLGCRAPVDSGASAKEKTQ